VRLDVPLPAAPPTSPRFALYAHDTMGMGHTRRNLLIAQALVEAIPGATVLLFAGAAIAGRFDLPPGVDCLSLPSLQKRVDGTYTARTLHVAVDELRRLRMAAIDGALRAFDPDLFLVDNVPNGAVGELLPVLERLRREGRTRTVLGLRDVLDAPAAVRREWRERDNVRTVVEAYDAIWVYGDAAAYDASEAYGFPFEVRRKLTHIGLLDARRRLTTGRVDGRTDGEADGEMRADARMRPGAKMLAGDGKAIDGDGRPLYLGLVGGGQDGAEVARAFAWAKAPEGARRVMITGPYMPASVAAELRAAAAAHDDLEVVSFVPEPAVLIQRAERVVAMGGYNTAIEVLAFGVPALIVPRVRPRLEQWERARYLARLGLIDVLHPARATSTAIEVWWRAPRSRPAADAVLDLGGLDRVPRLALELLRSAPVAPSSTTASSERRVVS
jgi:predicted glycosyltransferase